MFDTKLTELTVANLVVLYVLYYMATVVFSIAVALFGAMIKRVFF